VLTALVDGSDQWLLSFRIARPNITPEDDVPAAGVVFFTVPLADRPVRDFDPQRAGRAIPQNATLADTRAELIDQALHPGRLGCCPPPRWQAVPAAGIDALPREPVDQECRRSSSARTYCRPTN
jgi:hypothetical protein